MDSIEEGEVEFVAEETETKDNCSMEERKTHKR